MTDERAFEMINNNEPVYFISAMMFQYFVDKGYIVGWRYSHGESISYTLESEITKDKTELYANHIYDNQDEAGKACQKMQKENGHVVITQKEYDEYMRLKKESQNGLD